jgi:hypothetical protein
MIELRGTQTIKNIPLKIRYEITNGRKKPIKSLKVVYTQDESKRKRRYKLSDITDEINMYKKKFKQKGKNVNIQALIKTHNAYYPSHTFNSLSDGEIKLSNSLIEYGFMFENPMSGEFDDIPILSFQLYFIESNKRSIGGLNELNDCFYKCLIFFGIKNIKCDYELKKLCNKDIDDMIDIDDIKNIIEDKVKTRINVKGDVNYNSNKKYKREVNINLINNHYKPIKQNNKIITNRKIRTKKDKTIVIYKFDEDAGKYKIYINSEVIYKVDLTDYKFKGKYIKIDFKDIKKLKNEIDTFEEAYKYVLQQMDCVKMITNGYINMREIGWINDMILHYMNMFLDRSKVAGIEPDKITSIEYEILENSVRGGYYKNTKLYNDVKKTRPEDKYMYDIDSCYPYILFSDRFDIAYTEPEYVKMTNNEFKKLDFYGYGLYNVKVYNSDDIEKNELFRFNNKNWYTHIDLNIAKKINLKYDLIEDNEYNVNVLLYKKRVKSMDIFREYMIMMKKYKTITKEQKIDCPIFKLLMSTVWGLLTQVNKLHIRYKNDDDIIIPQKYKINQFTNKKIECVNGEQPYRFDMFGRMKPFILSKQRYNFYNDVLSKYNNKIVAIMVDGIVTNKKLENVKKCEKDGYKLMGRLYLD